MNAEDLAAYGLAAAGITTLLVQILNDAWVSASPLTATQRAAVLRGCNVVLNLGLLLLAVVSRGTFRMSDLFLYIAVACGQSIGSHVGWAMLSKNGAAGRGSVVLAPAPLTATTGFVAVRPGTPELPDDLPTIPRGS